MKTLLIFVLSFSLFGCETFTTLPDGTVIRSRRGPTPEELAAWELLVKNGVIDYKEIKNLKH